MAYGLTKSADLVAASSQYASRADDALLDVSTDFTVEGWFKFDIDIGGGTNLVSKYGAAGSRSYRFAVYKGGAGADKIVFWSRISVDGTALSGTDVDSGVVFALDTWYHIALTRSGTTMTFFIDGVDVGSTTVSSSNVFNSGSATEIGSSAAGGASYLDGHVSLVRIWKGEARTEAEIAANMCEVLGSTTNLSAEWTLNDTLLDNSGNGLTLSNVNTFTFAEDVPATCGSAPAAEPPARLLSLLGVG